MKRISVGLKQSDNVQFAASLLMPAPLVRAQADALGGAPLSDDAVTSLAQVFMVSEQA